jgi:hypothetical protein
LPVLAADPLLEWLSCIFFDEVPKISLQYLNYKALKKQITLLEGYLENARAADEALVWLKLLFQRMLDAEIGRVLDFYALKTQEHQNAMDELATTGKQIVLAILNVRSLVLHR